MYGRFFTLRGEAGSEARAVRSHPNSLERCRTISSAFPRSIIYMRPVRFADKSCHFPETYVGVDVSDRRFVDEYLYHWG